MLYNDEIIIFKNDRIGDLITSIPAIRLLIRNNKDKKITIFLSKINHKIKFLFDYSNVNIIIVEYKLTLKNRLFILFYLLRKKISKIYIIRPKIFFFYLPVLFYYKKIRFYALCIDAKDNYKRPYEFLRKFLYKKVINDRNTRSIRPTRKQLQINLVSDNQSFNDEEKNLKFNVKDELSKILPQDYCLIHYKYLMFNELSWGREGLEKILDQLLLNYSNVILINDIDRINDNDYFKKKYDWDDFKSKKYNITNNKVLYLENIDGIDLAGCISLSKITIACHGTITLLGDILKTPILDFFYCTIKNKDDYYRYKNSFHEHVPNNHNYKFIIPKKDIFKTINKMKFALKNE